MAIFDELRAEYTTWDQTQIDYHDALVHVASRFVAGFKEYVGAPNEFRTFPERKSRPYVGPKCVDLDGQGTYQITEPKHNRDFLQQDNDGWWRFGMSIVLDRAPERQACGSSRVG